MEPGFALVTMLRGGMLRLDPMSLRRLYTIEELRAVLSRLEGAS